MVYKWHIVEIKRTSDYQIMFEKKEVISDKLFRELKEMIITNKLKQGSPLSERKLCVLLNASRTPIREALRKLYNDHFVELKPDYGAFVSIVTFEQVSQIYDIREMLEALAVRSFTQSINDQQIETIKEIHRNLITAINKKQYEEALNIDLFFHKFIIEESKNELLQSILISIFDHIRRIINLTNYTDDWAHESLDQHNLIFECILNKDVSGAEKSMRKHSRTSKKHQLEQWKKVKQ